MKLGDLLNELETYDREMQVRFRAFNSEGDEVDFDVEAVEDEDESEYPECIVEDSILYVNIIDPVKQ